MSKNSIAKIFFHTIVFLVASYIAYPQPSTDSIRQIIEREVNNKRSASIAVGIIDTNGTQFFSYGAISESNTLSPNDKTIYEIGSITKVFTALLLADMSFKRELSLYDPISKFLPKTVKCPDRNGKEIRLVDLATHTSGLPNNPDNLDPKDANNPLADYSVEQMYYFLSNYKLPRDIGSKYEYSSYGMGLLGHILTLVSGSDYETLVKERITGPLNMRNTVITLTPALKENLATGHNNFGKPVNLWDMPTLAGAAALRSDVKDLLIFLSANLELLETKLIPAMQLTHEIRDGTGIPDLYIALGWQVFRKDGREVHFHLGGVGGFRTFIGLETASKTGAVVLSGSTNSIEDIALHIFFQNHPVKAYNYKWLLVDTIRRTITDNGIEAAKQLYYKLKQAHLPEFHFDEEQLGTLGYELLDEQKNREAVALFKLNAIEYPQSWRVYDSLGEAYMNDGNKKLAIESYQKSVELNPGNANGINKLKKLKAKRSHRMN